MLVINPFTALPALFTEEERLRYINYVLVNLENPEAYKQLAPHVYSLAANAYRCLVVNKKNQAIVISGESGAGKTENAKFCMNVFTTVAK